MKDDFSPLISIEKFAAYLDGNLSEDESRYIASLMESDEDMRLLCKMNEDMDKSIARFEEEDYEVPQEIISLSFDLPEIANYDSELMSPFPEQDSGQFDSKLRIDYEGYEQQGESVNNDTNSVEDTDSVNDDGITEF